MEIIQTLRAKIGKWADRLTLPERFIIPLFTLQWGCGTEKWPNPLNLTITTGHRQDASLYYNGIIFFRAMLPFYLGLMVRWSGDPKVKKQYMQVHFGWKLNGDLAATIRFQNDTSSAQGTYGHNYNQAQGWAYGTH